jgi:Cd2+/Zn2+-exporting ATPase
MSAPVAAPAASTCTRCAVHAESVFRVDGMCCGEEARILERRLRPLDGIEDLSADVVGQRLHVKYDAALLSTNGIVDAVAETGMRAWLEHEKPLTPASSASRGRFVFLSAAALAVGLVLPFVGVADYWTIPAFALAVLFGGIYTCL